MKKHTHSKLNDWQKALIAEALEAYAQKLSGGPSGSREQALRLASDVTRSVDITVTARVRAP